MNRNHWILLSIIIILGLGLRLYGCTWGMPYTFHADETKIFDDVLRMRHYHNFQPNVYIYSALPKHITLFIANLIAPNSPLNAQSVVLITRFISVFLGTATIILIYLTGRLAYGPAVGLLSASFLSFTVLHLRNSHFGTVDVPQAFFITLALFTAQWVLGRKKGLPFLAIAIGIAAGFKITGFILIVVLLVTHALILKRRSIRTIFFSRRLCFCIILAFLTFIVLCPYYIIDFRRYLEYFVPGQFMILKGMIIPRWALYFIGKSTLLECIKNLLWGMGPLLALAGSAGVIYAAFRHRPSDLILLAFAIPYGMNMAGLRFPVIRYFIILIPILTLLAARFLIALHYYSRYWWYKTSVGIIITIILTSTAFYAFAYTNIYSNKDARILCEEWVRTNIKKGEKVLVDWSDDSLLLKRNRPCFASSDDYQVNELKFDVLYYNADDLDRFLAAYGRGGKLKEALISRFPPLFRKNQHWTVEKRGKYLNGLLNDSNYIIFSEVNYRRYSRLGDYFPLEEKFFSDLFQHNNDFRLEKIIAVYPQLGNITINDESADMTFRLFDHPKMYIFRRNLPYVYECEEALHQTGEEKVEPSASGVRSWYFSKELHQPGYLVYGPYRELRPGSYKVLFRLKGDMIPTEKELAVIDVTANIGKAILAEKKITGKDFIAPGEKFHDFRLSFTIESDNDDDLSWIPREPVHKEEGLSKVEFRIRCTGNGNLWADVIIVEKLDK